jgi:hypothetical protein
MCNKSAIEGVKNNLRYVVEDVDSAMEHAKGVKDPELTNKLTKLKTEAVGITDYIKSKTDSKTG